METMPHHLAARQNLPQICQGLGQPDVVSAQLPISPLVGKDLPQSQGLCQGLGPFPQGPGSAVQSQGLAQGHPHSSSHASSSHSNGRRRRESRDYHHR